MQLRKTILEQSLWKTSRLHQTRISLHCIIIKKKKKAIKFRRVNRNKVFNTGKVPSAIWNFQLEYGFQDWVPQNHNMWPTEIFTSVKIIMCEEWMEEMELLTVKNSRFTEVMITSFKYAKECSKE